MLALAILTTRANIAVAINRSLSVARKYPIFSAWVDVGTGGTDLMQSHCWHVIRRSKTWAEIDISTSDNSNLSGIDPNQSRGIYELKAGLLTVYAPTRKIYSETKIKKAGDALEQLSAIFDAREKASFLESEQEGVDLACSPGKLKSFLGPYRKVRNCRREAVEKWVAFSYTVGRAETNLTFDAATGRFSGWWTGPIDRAFGGDNTGVGFRFAPAGAVPVLKIPDEARHVDDVGPIGWDSGA
jgi:hypothetical protein